MGTTTGDALHGAPGDEHGELVRRGAEGGDECAGREEGEAAEENTPVAEQVPEPPGDRRGDGAGQHERGEHPGDLACRGAQLAAERG